MNTLSARTSAIVLGAGALLLATASEARMPAAPLKSEIGITQVAQGCGPGRWRTMGGWGWCRGKGNTAHAQIIRFLPSICPTVFELNYLIEMS